MRQIRWLLDFIYAVFTAPTRLAVGAYRWVVKATGGAGQAGASLSLNILATIICNSAAWAVIALGFFAATRPVWNEAWPPPCSGKRFCVIVAGLEGDDARGSQTQYIRRSLERAYAMSDPERSVDVIMLPRQLSRPYSGDVTTNRLDAEALGQTWLTRMKADVLIYGSVVARGHALELHFYPLLETQGSSGLYVFDHFTLPARFNTDFGNALAAIVAAISRSSLAPRIKIAQNPRLGSIFIFFEGDHAHTGNVGIVTCVESAKTIQIFYYAEDGSSYYVNDPVVSISRDSRWSLIRIWDIRKGRYDPPGFSGGFLTDFNLFKRLQCRPKPRATLLPPSR